MSISDGTIISRLNGISRDSYFRCLLFEVRSSCFAVRRPVVVGCVKSVKYINLGNRLSGDQ